MASANTRIHEIKSPVDEGGEATFQLRKMRVEEKLSTPFKYTVDTLSEKYYETDIDPNKLLGEPVTVTITHHERPRHFHGLVSHVIFLGRFGNYAHIRLELRPWFWFLSHNADCRIFQEMDVKAIYEKVTRDTHGFADYRISATGSYTQREYCVQYRESDFAFLSRLLEEEGIFYYFEHEEDKHTMVLADAPTSFKDVEGDKEIPYRLPGEAPVDLEHIWEWRVEHNVRTGKYVHDDYDFKKPNVDLEGEAETSRDYTHADFEVYDYPGRYLETSEGSSLAQIRNDEIQATHKLMKGLGDHKGLMPGGLFELKDYPNESQNAEYALLEVTIDIESAEIEQLRDNPQNVFDVEFVAFEGDTQYRPPRTTRKPIVQGPQTAVVVGKQGEEIWTDEYGRVKVQFHWDREGEKNENSSCFIRVSQLWGGKSWGGMHIPRIGQEVVVDFLEGDPDRPLITGRVYNDEQTVPYQLPDNQTQSGIKSRSTKDGTPDNFNELRFEDKKDEEQVYFHAEKDFERIVENNDVLKIGFEKSDPGDQTIEIFNDQMITVGQNRTAEIQEGDDTTTVSQGNHGTTVSQGNHSIAVSAGKSTIEAAQEITLKVGGSTIKITPSEITLSAPTIKITGQAQAEMSAPMATLNGSGMATVKGGLVKIN